MNGDDNDQIIEIPGVGRVAFPASMGDDQINAAARRLHGESLEQPRERPEPESRPINPATAIGSNIARGAAVRVGEQLATSPNLGRVVSAASGPVAREVAGAIGSHAGGLTGYAAGKAITNPTVGAMVENLIRGNAAVLAKFANSRAARVATGPASAALSVDGMPLNATPVGERPGEANETSERDIAARQFMQQVNREAGRKVITGNTTREIIDSIAAYNGGTR